MSFQTNLFAGRRALVTGGTSGIGKGVALYLAQLGATVHAVGLQAGRCEFPSNLPIHLHELDVTDDLAVAELFAQIPSLDFLIPAAGISITDSEHESEAFDKVIRVNLTAVMRACTLARPKMVKAGGGSIVLVASMYSTFGSGDRPAYSASKGAIVQLTKSLALAYSADRIRVNGVAPGWIDTPLVAPLKAVPEIANAILGRTPLARFGTTEDVAKAVAFLCSDAASFVQGATLPVDGGYLIA